MWCGESSHLYLSSLSLNQKVVFYRENPGALLLEATSR